MDCVSRDKYGDKEVTVALTPNGYADGINKKDDVEYFVMPEDRQMSMADFIEMMERKRWANIRVFPRIHVNLRCTSRSIIIA